MWVFETAGLENGLVSFPAIYPHAETKLGSASHCIPPSVSRKFLHKVPFSASANCNHLSCSLQPSRDLRDVFTYVPKMADEAEGDTPPPLPSSPIPSAETFEDLQEDESQSSSKKFSALQKMLSSSRTMYTQPGPPPIQHDRSATGLLHTNSGPTGTRKSVCIFSKAWVLFLLQSGMSGKRIS